MQCRGLNNQQSKFVMNMAVPYTRTILIQGFYLCIRPEYLQLFKLPAHQICLGRSAFGLEQDKEPQSLCKGKARLR